MGQIWGTETSAALRISKQSVRAEHVYKHGLELLTFKMFLLSGNPGLTQPVPSACLSQTPATQTLSQPIPTHQARGNHGPCWVLGSWSVLQSQGILDRGGLEGQGEQGVGVQCQG